MRLYYIINPQSGKALDVNGGGRANGTNIHLWERNGTGAQKWVIQADGSIINPQSGKALDVSGGGKSNGTNIHLWEKNGTEAQKWVLEPVPEDTVFTSFGNLNVIFERYYIHFFHSYIS